MKRKVVLSAAIVLCAFGSITFLNHSKKTGTDVLTQNVEALAGGEILNPVHCLGKGCVDCPINGVKVEYVMSGWSLDY